MDCIFCKIARKEINTDIILERDGFIAFKDINPQAPVHIIIIPVEHIERVSALTDANAGVVGNMVLMANVIAKNEGISEEGYRLIINCNDFGGQTVYHLHLHLIGGREMGWPPG